MEHTNKMVDPYVYLEYLRKNSAVSKFGWKLGTSTKADETYAKRKLKRSFEVLGQSESYDALSHLIDGEQDQWKRNRGVGDYDRLMQALASSLKDDINECTEGSFSDVLSKTAVGLLPIGLSNAFCINETLVEKDGEFEEELDGSVICVNEGLYFCLQMLAKCIVLENLNGELIEYRESGSSTYKEALKMYLEPSTAHANSIFFKAATPELNGELSAYQSSIAMIILQFIALHEFGHIVNGDLDIMGLHKLHMVHDEDGSASGPVSPSYVEAEYLADEFALRALCNRSKKPLNAWANFSSIYLFFHWLDSVEKILGKPISNLHPPPLKRANRLHELMISIVGHESSFGSHLDWVKESTASWYDAENKEISHETRI